MEILDRPEPSRKFLEERTRAMLNIQQKFDKFNASLKSEKESFRWIKTELSYPSFDDFTFAYKNKIFSVIVEIAEKINGKRVSFGNEQRVKRLLDECRKNNLTPCIYPVIKNSDGGYIFLGYPASLGCWNLVEPGTRRFIDPIEEASDELIEVSEWEFQNLAVGIVSKYLSANSFKLLSYCDILGIEPNIWFENDSEKKCWVEVLYTTYPDNNKSFSFKNWPAEVLKHDGYKAVVSFAKPDDFSGKIYRAQEVFVNFDGIEQVYKSNNQNRILFL